MTYPWCQAENSGGPRFGEARGTRLDVTSAACGWPVGADTKFRRSYGAPLAISRPSASCVDRAPPSSPDPLALWRDRAVSIPSHPKRGDRVKRLPA